MLQNKLKYFCELQINKQRCESTYDYLSADVICSDKRKGYQEISVLYGPANDPRTANDSQVVPQMIPGPELIPPQKVRNGVDSMKSLWIHIFLIILGEEKTSTSGIKAAIKNVYHTAQNTKLTCVDCINFSFRKRTTKRNMNLQICLCHLINRLELFPVHFLYLRPR